MGLRFEMRKVKHFLFENHFQTQKTLGVSLGHEVFEVPFLYTLYITLAKVKDFEDTVELDADVLGLRSWSMTSFEWISSTPSII